METICWYLQSKISDIKENRNSFDQKRKESENREDGDKRVLRLRFLSGLFSCSSVVFVRIVLKSTLSNLKIFTFIA